MANGRRSEEKRSRGTRDVPALDKRSCEHAQRSSLPQYQSFSKHKRHMDPRKRATLMPFALSSSKHKAQIAKSIAQELFAALGIESPLNDVEQVLVDRYGMSEQRYRSEKIMLTAFAMEGALLEIAERDHTQVAALANVEWARLMTEVLNNKGHDATREFMARFAAYKKALDTDKVAEGGLMIALPLAFSTRVIGANESARPFLVALVSATYAGAVSAVYVIFKDETVKL